MDHALVFDTETTGKVLWHRPHTDPGQPHIVQLAAALVSEEGWISGGLNRLVRPQGWRIPAEATAIHGITNEKATTLGVPLENVMESFAELCSKVEVVVAHNIDFDYFMVQVETARLGIPNPLEHLQQFCTMKGSMYVCNIPSPYGKIEPKWPTLDEAHRTLVGRSVEGAHDAMVDVEACARVYAALHRRLRRHEEAAS